MRRRCSSDRSPTRSCRLDPADPRDRAGAEQTALGERRLAGAAVAEQVQPLRICAVGYVLHLATPCGPFSGVEDGFYEDGLGDHRSGTAVWYRGGAAREREHRPPEQVRRPGPFEGAQMLDRRWRKASSRVSDRSATGCAASASPPTPHGVRTVVSVRDCAADRIRATSCGRSVGVVVSGVADLLDGAIARGSGQASRGGAFFDSVTDRASDALLFGRRRLVPGRPLAVLRDPGVRGRRVLVMISYERARARVARPSTRVAG